MKVQILGLKSREYVNPQTGVRRWYTDIFYQMPFAKNELDSGAMGVKCDHVTTTFDCSGFSAGDVVNFDYGPTGYKNQDGSDQIRLLSIDLLEQAKH